MKGGQGLEDLEMLLIDGDNFLHQARGLRDEGGVAWLLPRLADWRPDGLDILVTLDGHPAPGESRRPRVARGIRFEHAGSHPADDVIIRHLGQMPFAQRARTAVVTRDRELQDRARKVGGLVRSVDWLLQRISESGAVASDSTRPVRIGQGKPPLGRHRPAAPPGDGEVERDGWEPGRGATRKKGNPRRSAKRKRQR